MSWRVIEADCIEAMAAMDEASVDAIVTDPPYGLEFMGKEWDDLGKSGVQRKASAGGGDRRAIVDPDEWAGGESSPFSRSRVRWQHGDAGPGAMQAWHQAWAEAALRVLKPGGHLLAFGGTRTYHRLACGLEDAGFEIRDCLAWMYGSGFPKSLDVSKAIDKAAGAEREVVGQRGGRYARPVNDIRGGRTVGGDAGGFDAADVTAPATPDAERWQGWGTALKPAYEPIVLARKPLVGTVAANVLEHGTGALNIDGARVETDGRPAREVHPLRDDVEYHPTALEGRVDGSLGSSKAVGETQLGRWPANVVLDEEAAAMLDEQSGELSPASSYVRGTAVGNAIYGKGAGTKDVGDTVPAFKDHGGASRFFYVPKADRAEREIGKPPNAPKAPLSWGTFQAEGTDRSAWNHHPTVKPVALMQWLCRLVTPPEGIVLDPFLGSGTTGMAALREGFSFVGIEREAEYVEIARDRIIGDAPLFNVASESAIRIRSEGDE